MVGAISWQSCTSEGIPRFTIISMISSWTKTEGIYNKLDEWVKWDKG